jgi:hypothetical protein
VKEYDTLSCKNLYAFTCERSFLLINNLGKFGMIIPNSSISADKLNPLQKIFKENKSSWISNYAWRPAKLFEGANMLLAIVLTQWSKTNKTYSSIYHRWYNDFRDSLFENIRYFDSTHIIREGSIPKVSSELIFSIISKQRINSHGTNLNRFFNSTASRYKILYFRAVLYWIKILEDAPVFREDGVQTTTGEMKPIYVQNDELKYQLISLLSSSIFFTHYITWSSCQVINSRDFEFLYDDSGIKKTLKDSLIKLGKLFQNDLQKNSTINTRNYSARGRSFTMEKQYFYIKQSKSIIDEIDTILAEHYNFSEKELDFIINYDIKYRMGKELGNEEEETEENEE